MKRKKVEDAPSRLKSKDQPLHMKRVVTLKKMVEKKKYGYCNGKSSVKFSLAIIIAADVAMHEFILACFKLESNHGPVDVNVSCGSHHHMWALWTNRSWLVLLDPQNNVTSRLGCVIVLLESDSHQKSRSISPELWQIIYANNEATTLTKPCV